MAKSKVFRLLIFKMAVVAVACLFLVDGVGALPVEEWNKTFGGKGDDTGGSVQQTLDGGYIIVGSTKSYGAGKYDVFIVKTDENGNQQWNKTFGGLEDEVGAGIQLTSDEGYIIAGVSYSAWADSRSDVFLMKISQKGNLVWDKRIGGIMLDDVSSFHQTSDDGYIIAGKTNSYGSGLDDAWLVKTDKNGNIEWSKTFGGESNDWASSVDLTSDDGYIFTGATNSYGAKYKDIWIVKIDSNGSLDWKKRLEGPVNEEAYSIQQTIDGGYIIAAGKNFPDSDALLIKTDKKGNIEWTRTFGGNGRDMVAFSVQQTKDGGYIINGLKDANAWLLKTDKEGNEKWEKTFGGVQCASCKQTKDGGYILAGTTNMFGSGDDDMWLIKLSGELLVTTSSTNNTGNSLQPQNFTSVGTKEAELPLKETTPKSPDFEAIVLLLIIFIYIYIKRK